MKGRRTMLLALIVLWGLGCESTNQNQNAMVFLERGRFRGKVRGVTTGAPISLNHSTSLGPGGSLTFEGELDFATPLDRDGVSVELVGGLADPGP